MANCPKCGSEHIQLTQQQNINWGNTIAGWALFGPVGGVIGAMATDDKTFNNCLDCGTAWNANDLYKLLQFIKSMTNINLDLAKESDRQFTADFLSEFGSDIEAITKVDKDAYTQVKDLENHFDTWGRMGCGLGCLFCFFLPILIPFVIVLAGAIAAIGEPIKKYFLQLQIPKNEVILREAERKKLSIERNIRFRAVDFKVRHGYES